MKTKQAIPTREIVWRILKRGGWITSYELAGTIWRDYGIWMTDSSATARIRDLRKVRYGNYTIKCRPAKEGKSWQYKLMS